MGFACPVCETPQQDATHLANHLAFTAMVHGDEHEGWLDDHVPEWETLGEAELAPEVAALAPDADYEQVFEDTANAHAGHDHQHRHTGSGGPPGGVDPETAAAAGNGSLDEETQQIIAEAREMTAEMFADAADAEGEDGPTDEAEGDGGPTDDAEDENDPGDDAADGGAANDR
ncbi:DUF5810 domain-containing protein [Halobellus clavatus]|jgi:hypothetical protein|uniref:Uncharacterized protein n=1 Tax=Halobellus clavatus TaxID=660517 RepID=A0A1H3JEU3_9EURY|nr:DUF5810 domain-containing protein [Halobellus clavatus]SDY38035.1 hypothetical protein SAMN04487946_11332 [Halobellus clavatus]